MEEWIKIRAEWLLDAFVLDLVPTEESPDEEFLNWLENKHPDFLKYLENGAKQINVRITHQDYDVMDYIKKKDGSFDRLAFQRFYFDLLNKARISDPQQINDVKWKLYQIFNVPRDL